MPNNHEQSIDSPQNPEIAALQQITELAADIRKHGDALDLAPDLALHILTTISSGALGAVILSSTFSALTASAHPKTEIAATMAGSFIAGVNTMQSENRIREQGTQTLHRQTDLSRITGENIELFRNTDKQLTLRWYGHNDTASSQKPLSESLVAVTALAEAAGVAAITMPAETAEALEFQDEPVSEKAWLKTIKARADTSDRTYMVTTVPVTEFSSKAQELVQSPDNKDDLLHAALDILAARQPNSKLGQLIRASDESYTPTALKQILPTLSRRIERTLEDTTLVRGADGEKTKIHKHGMLAHTMSGRSQAPQIRWLGEGRFVDNENLWHFLGTSPENQTATLTEATDVKKQEAAALLIAFTEIQKALQGKDTTTIPTNAQQHPYQANLKVYKGFFTSKEPQDHTEVASKLRTSRTLRFVGKLGVCAVLGLSTLGALSYYHEGAWSKDGTSINEVFVGIENILDAPFELLPEPNLNKKPANSSDGASGAGVAIGAVSDSPNRLVWSMESYNDADSEGYWVDGTYNLLDFAGSTPQWQAELWRDSNNVQVDDHITSEEIGTKPITAVKGFVSLSDVYNSRELIFNDAASIPIPIKVGSLIIGANLQVGDTILPASVNAFNDGTYYVNLRQTLDTIEKPVTDEGILTYWLEETGVDGFAQATAPVTVIIEGTSTSYPVSADASVATLRQAGLAEADISGVSKHMKQKEYSVAPSIEEDIADEQTLLQNLVTADSANCNTANTAFVLAGPTDYNLASGYLNSNRSADSEILSSHEAHAFAVNADGAIFDSTPSDTNGDDQDFFSENFKYKDPFAPRENGQDLPVQEAAFGLAGLAALGLGYGGIRTARLARERTKRSQRFEEASDITVNSAYEFINHTLFAPEGVPLTLPTSTSKTKQGVKDTVATYVLTTKDRRALNKTLKSRAATHNIPKATLIAAQDLIQSI